MEGSFGFEQLGINHAADEITPANNFGEPPFVATSGCFEGITQSIPPPEDIRTSDSDDTPEGEWHIWDGTTCKTGKKKHRCTKSREQKRDLVFGEGIGMDKLEQTSQTVLV